MKNTLGRDFWWYRGGEFLSDLGTSAHALAVAWWVLEQTGSATSMALILVPVAVTRLVALPLLAPLGDRLSRKHLMLWADAGMVVISLAMAALFVLNIMSIPLLATLSVALAFLSGLFSAGSQAVITNLVDKNQIQQATQQVQALGAMTMLFGGIFGAALVALIGVSGAMLVDAVSFFASMVGVGMIRANTRPVRKENESNRISMSTWSNDFTAGLKTVIHVKVLLGLVLVAALLNMAFAPLQILVPYLIKESLGLTPWHVGLVETAIGIAIIVGSLTVGLVTKKLPSHSVIILGIVLAGVSLLSGSQLPYYGAFIFITAVMVMGVTWCNVLIGAQASVAVPDQFRTRVNSIINTIATAAMPIGLAATGFLVDQFGGWNVLLGSAVVALVIVPLMFMVPNLVEFFDQPSEEVEAWMTSTYPEAFLEKS